MFLKAGESKTVSFKITPELLRFYDYDLNHVAEPGDFDVMIGGSSQAEKTARLTLNKIKYLILHSKNKKT